jgi:N-acetylglucosaminyldiphosphoundecaprenol N-acetyl-beta-D-mannosaminyltransferase
MKNIKILEVKINNVTMTESIDIIDSFIKSKKPHQIVTANPEIIMSAQNNVGIKDIINDANLVIPDGAGLLFTAKILRQKLVERVTGVDLINNIANLANEKKYSIYLLGALPGIAKKCANILAQKYPNLKIAGHSSDTPDNISCESLGYNNPKHTSNYKKVDANVIIDNIKLTKPDILLVAYGHPKQEFFISKYKDILNIPVMIGVGGSFDFIAGIAKRAPKIMQILWLEWLWRLMSEPKRIKRIFTAAIIFPLKVIYNMIFKIK